MQRKFLKTLFILLFIFVILFALFGVWTWYQMSVSQSLQVGNARVDSILTGLVIPQTAVFYGAMVGFFILATVLSIVITYRLVVPPQDENLPITDDSQ